jgi:hypothetical protein
MRRRKFITLLGGAGDRVAVGGAGAATGAHAADRRARGPREPTFPNSRLFANSFKTWLMSRERILPFDWRYAERGPDQLPILAQQLVDLHPDIIVSITTPATAAVKATTGNRVAGVP